MTTQTTKAMMVAALLTGGCTADLGVYRADGTKVKGYPVSIPVTYVLTGQFTRHKKLGAKCTPTPFPAKFQTLGTGETYFVDPETGPLANSEFALQFSKDGVVTAVTLNSESNLPETLDSTANLIGSIAELASPAPAIAVTGDAVACDTGEDVKRVQTLPEFVANPSSN